MTIKQQGGIFGRNPTFNDVGAENLTASTSISSPLIDTLRLTDDGSSGLRLYSKQSGGRGLIFASGIIYPSGNSGATNNNGTDLGTAGVRFKDIYTNNVKLASGGGILCGVTSTDRNAVVRADLSQGVVGSAVYISRSGGSTAKSQIEFANSNGVVGSITTSGSATAYNTSSDYRLKTDAQPMTGASDRVKLLSPVNFEWISDGTRVDGFLAHEVQEIVPEAVHGAKDAMREEEYEVTPAALDEDGNVITEAVLGTRQVPDYQAIDQSKLVPVLTAALQEALAKIEQLESRVASLEV